MALHPRGIRLLVAVGASAGGLEALTELVAHLPTGAGAAYVVAQHLAPDQPSLIVTLLAESSTLPVVTATDGLVLRPDVVHVGPPHHDLTVDGTRLHLVDPGTDPGPHPVVDRLFGSAAEHWAERSVAVVLSGTGSDGALGMQQVRAAGGLGVAQSTPTARFAAMPDAAAHAGGADLVREPAQIGVAVQDYATATRVGTGRPPVPPVALADALARLRSVTGIDFSRYKTSTLLRQVARRQAVRQLGTIGAYLDALADDPDEARALAANLLVTVTRFFRDPQVFDALQSHLGAYAAGRAPEEPLRVWVPGCATGEEVYSVAMVVAEVLGRPADLASRVKIFGTDLNEASLAVARRGRYPAKTAAGVPAPLRARYLVESDGEYDVVPALREAVVFARHDVTSDPPFPRLDVVSCRNTLIYFTAALQDRVVELLRHALRPGGLLLLGASETLGRSAGGFDVLDAKHRLFARTHADQRTAPTEPGRPWPTSVAPRIRHTPPAAGVADHDAVLDALVSTHLQPGLVIDAGGEVIEVIGDVGPYCRVPHGRVATGLAAFVRPELQGEARLLLLSARAGRTPVPARPVSLPGRDEPVLLQVRPLQVADAAMTVLSFVDLPAGTPATTEPDERTAALDREVQLLEQELRDSRETLRAALDDQEAAHEELQASAEELQASSEELQASYEELETSNEELRATNDELGSTNARLEERGRQLAALNDDLENIEISSTQGMVLLDEQLRVTRFTPLAVRLFALVAADVGRPLLEVPTTMVVDGLVDALHAVVGGAQARTVEVSDDRAAYLVQVLPYVAAHSGRRGAILTLSDITSLVELRRRLERALTDGERVTDALPAVIWKRTAATGALVSVSHRIADLLGIDQARVLAEPGLLDDAVHPEDRAAVAAARAAGSAGWSVEYRLDDALGARRWVREEGRYLPDPDGDLLVGTFTDVSELVEAHRRAAEASEVFESVFRTPMMGVALLDLHARVVLANEAFCALVDQDASAVLHRPLPSFFQPQPDETSIDYPGQIAHGSLELQGSEHPLRLPDGRVRWVQVSLTPMRAPVGPYTAVLLAEDVTALHETTERLRLQATVDPATGLLNQESLRGGLAREIARATRGGRELALAWIDLDRFKSVNDELGHDAGDAVLQAVARRVARVVRRSDLVGRLGGDEFGVVITDYDSAVELESVLERILLALREPVEHSESSISIEGSVGVALCPSDGDRVEVLMRAADAAMYNVKSGGGGGYAYFRADMRKDADGRHRRRAVLAAAVEHREFTLYYQPIVDLHDDSVHGLEALVRWRRGARVIPASEFIGFCEDSGLVVPLGYLTVELVQADRATLRRAGHGALHLAVNAAVKQLEDARLGEVLAAWPGPTGLDGITVEVTEAVFLPDRRRAMQALAALQAQGAAVSVDDFGSGFSNFRLLESLAPASIKLDRSFLGISDTSGREALLRAAIELGHALGADVVVEGIETQDQLDQARRLGADRAQGYLVARPMPLTDCLTWLAARAAS